MPSPVFVLSPVRSGSTLFRVILDSHSEICAPHELHLQVVRIRIEERHKYAKVAMKQLGLSESKLENLLWDRILHRTLVASGKKLIVDKTPQNVFGYERLTTAWPKARFIFLIRHPASIADSLARSRKAPVEGAVAKRVNEYVAAMEKARANLCGLTVRYEDLVADPESVTTEVCRYLGLRWERSMLDYGAWDHGPLVAGVGDWSPAIRSGEIKPSREIPDQDDIADELRDACRVWGYLS
ncbi:MAG TPA: sulfotransferase [Mycobacteriales bacterium]|nr:sulfotransferase [Mycobacteriales bacterium]